MTREHVIHAGDRVEWQHPHTHKRMRGTVEESDAEARTAHVHFDRARWACPRPWDALRVVKDAGP